MVSAKRLQQDGYIAMMTVLILGAVATAIGIALLLTGADAQRLVLGEQQSRQARSLAVACGQEALQQIHDNIGFTATNTSMSLGLGTCQYSVGVTGAGSTRLVNASGTVGDITRKVQAGVTINASTITVSSWRDSPERYANISYVQGANMTNDATATTAAVAFPSNVTTGNFIAVAVSWDPTSSSVFSCSDSRGNTYTNIGAIWNDSTNMQAISVCYAQVTAGNAADTVTVTFGASSTFRRVIVSEYSGVATTSPVDTYVGIAGGTTVSTTDGTATGNVTTTQDGDLIFGVINLTAALRAYSPGTGYIERMYTNTKDVSVEDRQQPLAGTVAGTWTTPTASDKVNLVTVAFKAAPQ